MTFTQHFTLYCDIATSKSIVQRAFKVSLIVGTILNLINQGDALLHLDIGNVHFIKLFLTYLVPYSVTTYTATAMKVEFQIATPAIVETDLVCATCKEQVHVVENQLIPECSQCGIHTKWKLA